MLKRTILIFVAVLATTSLVLAQGGGGGNRGGGFGGGQRMGGMGGGDLALLQRPDVQKDLKLTDDQKKAVAKIQEDNQAAMRARMESMRSGGGGGGDREAMMAEFQKMQKETDAKVKAVLTPEQQTRLKQINIQLGGSRVVLREDGQKQLGLPDEQKKKLTALQTAMNEANQAIMQRMRDQEITREEVQELQAKNNKTMDDEIAKVLTAEQKTKLEEMKGAKFEADPNYRPGGAGGRGGRGGGN